MDQEYLTPVQAAYYLLDKYNKTHSIKYLSKLRHTGGGAAYYRLGGNVFYTMADLDEWMAGRTKKHLSTSTVVSN